MTTINQLRLFFFTSGVLVGVLIAVVVIIVGINK